MSSNSKRTHPLPDSFDRWLAPHFLFSVILIRGFIHLFSGVSPNRAWLTLGFATGSVAPGRHLVVAVFRSAAIDISF